MPITFQRLSAFGLASLITATALPALHAQAPGAAARPAAVKAPTSPVTGNATAGKKVYTDYSCYSCHGFNGETGARAFVPNWPANLATESSFIAFLRGRGDVAPVEPSTRMPFFAAESLSDAQARDLYAYIRTFKSNQPAVEQIPVFKQILAEAEKPYKP